MSAACVLWLQVADWQDGHLLTPFLVLLGSSLPPPPGVHIPACLLNYDSDAHQSPLHSSDISVMLILQVWIWLFG